MGTYMYNVQKETFIWFMCFSHAERRKKNVQKLNKHAISSL